MDKIRVDGSNGLRFPQRRSKLPFVSGPSGLVSSASQSFLQDSKEINPNKAVFTIDSNTGQILIVNNNACQLLGYTSHEFRQKEFFELLTNKNKCHVSALAELQLDSIDGTMVLLSGKVVEMNTKQNVKVAVSLWIRQIDPNGRCLAVAEPVERRICQIQIDLHGFIIHADYETQLIFQYESLDQLIDSDISTLIPAIKLPDTVISKSIRKQKATGRTTDNTVFPLCLLMELRESSTENTFSNTTGFNITVWVFQNLSGLIVVDEFGNIQSCNQHFSSLMFGYNQERILNMHISSLIPNFGKEQLFVESRSRNMTNSSFISDEWNADTDIPLNDIKIPTPGSDKPQQIFHEQSNSEQRNIKDLDIDNNLFNFKINQIREEDNYCDTMNKSHSKFDKTHLTIHCINEPDSGHTRDDIVTPVNTGISFSVATSQVVPLSEIVYKESTSSSSTSKNSKSPKMFTCLEGRFQGEARHSDDNVIDIVYSVSSKTLSCARTIYCIWICRDPDTLCEHESDKHPNLTLTFNSITSTVEHSLGQVIKSTAVQNTSRPNSVALVSQYGDEQITGDFNKFYTTLKQIGKGAYGYVKMSYRNTDRLLVVTKFILKEKLCSHFMIMDDEKKETPIEVYLLRTVKHPNIVSVLDVFENELFFQLVMEKHGCGMDLFEFIERRPLMDEMLGSYIFRQIANAVNYLHELNILHRDIKDENIIIDHHFHVKLIDFGSATFMEDGKLFSTFYGTTEYCSPEVLAGNKYSGPELEMWSLGVTLYVLMFFENPFIDIEETLKTDLLLPHEVSSLLDSLLHSMLNKNPINRCTMQQLVEDSWLNQEVNPTIFNFAWIVPCESHESNPEKYFSGQQYTSTNALWTISPEESLSLVDESSITNNDVYEEDSPEKSCINLHMSQKCICKTCVLGSRTLNDGSDITREIQVADKYCIKLKPEKIITNIPIITDVLKYTSIEPVGPSSSLKVKMSHSFSDLCECVQTRTSLKNITSKNENFISERTKMLPARQIGVHNLACKGCTGIYSLSKMAVSEFSLNKLCNSTIMGKDLQQRVSFSKSDSDCQPSEFERELLKVEDNLNILSTSKSENNISEENVDSSFLVCKVVSLNSLNVDDQFPNCTINDQSNIKVLNKLFDPYIDEKHIFT